MSTTATYRGGKASVLLKEPEGVEWVHGNRTFQNMKILVRELKAKLEEAKGETTALKKTMKLTRMSELQA